MFIPVHMVHSDTVSYTCVGRTGDPGGKEGKMVIVCIIIIIQTLPHVSLHVGTSSVHGTLCSERVKTEIKAFKERERVCTSLSAGAGSGTGTRTVPTRTGVTHSLAAVTST